MQKQTVAVPTSFPNFSAQLDVRTIEPSTLVGQLSASLGPNDQFAIYGSVDPASAGASVNLSLLANIAGDNGQTRLNTELRGWPYLFVQRLSGSSPGSFIAEGDLAQNTPVAPVNAALPTAGNFVQLSFATFASPVRVSLDGSQTTKDVFNVYGTNDPAANSTSGAVLIGKMTGGAAGLAAASPTSVLVSGYYYALVERLSGATPGNAEAWGAGAATGGGGGGSSPSVLNKGMLAQNTGPGDGSLAMPGLTGAVGAIPVGYVYVVVNGVVVEPALNDAVRATSACYFSINGGLNAVAQGAIPAGALLYWNGSIAGYQLSGPVPGPQDFVDYLYNS
jgi:hypothetical protein